MNIKRRPNEEVVLVQKFHGYINDAFHRTTAEQKNNLGIRVLSMAVGDP